MSTATSNDETVRRHLERLLLALSAALPDADLQAARHYLEHNEHGVAFEHLCEQLYAHNARITQGVYKTLERLGELMAYPDDSYWADLKAQVV